MAQVVGHQSSKNYACIMITKEHYNTDGFTLVEILLYAAIVAIMTTAIAGMLALSLQARVKNQVIESVESGAAIVLSDITTAIQNSQAVSLSIDGNGDAIVTVDVFDAAKDPTIYQLDGGVMTKKEGAASPVDISSSNIVLDQFTATDNTPAGETMQVISFGFDAAYLSASSRQEFHYHAPYQSTAYILTP